MKQNMKLVTAFIIVAIFGGAIVGGVVWWTLQPKSAAAGTKAPAKEVVDTKIYKFLTLEKVIVMLRRSAADPAPHYLATDLVIKVAHDKEAVAKEQLPLLRSIAVKALSAVPMDKAQFMTVDQFAGEVNRAFNDSYAREHREKPFSDVMIGKLIIE